MENKKKVIIIGAGPGGLACGMLLTKNGYNVNFYEQKDYVGGRNGSIQSNGFKFDIGPTFFLMKNVLEEIFEETGRKLDDYVELTQLDPMYRLQFKDHTFFPSTDEEKMLTEIERLFPGSSDGYRKYMTNERIKYDKLIPCLQIPYGKLSDFFSKRLIKSLPYLDAHVSLYDVLSRYFKDPDMLISFTFQAKYIGMSPWEAPGTFSIISFIEHGGGIFHVTGGLNMLSQAMAKCVVEDGAKINLNSRVKKVIVENGVTKGIELMDGTKYFADYVVINADFADAMTTIVDKEDRNKYTQEKLDSMKYSCSTFMLYLGLDKLYDNINHHNIFFADDYRNNVNEIAVTKVLPTDPSFYVQNASLTDNTLAPEGKSALYVLVPIANTTGSIDWRNEADKFKERILELLETKAGLTDIRKHIEFEQMITPLEWKEKRGIYNGATFNLGHNVSQMLYFRPHNEFEEFKNCYLVGGGTHPGSGLPTIYESGRISAKMIMDKDK
jgi:phytoene desaturase